MVFQKGPATSLPQIPAAIPSTEEEKIEDEKKSAKQYDEDSITEEIADLPNPESAKEHSEWVTIIYIHIFNRNRSDLF